MSESSTLSFDSFDSSDRYTTMTCGIGTPTHMAPEVWEMRGKSRMTKKIDTYSFGIIMWEILELKPAWHDINFSYKISRKVCRGERPKISHEHKDSKGGEPPKAYIEIMKQCWESDPKSRPKFSDVRKVFVHFCSGFYINFSGDGVPTTNQLLIFTYFVFIFYMVLLCSYLRVERKPNSDNLSERERGVKF